MLTDEHWQAGRLAWPGIEVSREELTAYVDELRRGQSADPTSRSVAIESAETLRASDVYLACACARGDSAAIATFENNYFSEVELALRRVRVSSPADEVRQLVRQKLFVSEPGRKPAIAQYSGRGDLRGWFRVTVRRLLLNLATRAKPEVPIEEQALGRLLEAAEPMLSDFPRESYKSAFRAAFPEAFQSLSERERSLLRYAFGEDLTVEMIGRVYGVHKTTAARWVVRAHEALLTTLRSIMLARLGISEEEYASALRRVRDSLELSLDRFLKT